MALFQDHTFLVFNYHSRRISLTGSQCVGPARLYISQIKTFQGRRVIVDDGLPTRAGTTDGTVYTTYLFGPGAFAKGSARLSSEPLQGGFGTEGVEMARVPLDSDTVLINRRRFLLHLRGVKWTGSSVAGVCPTNTELEDSANWSRVYENKNVRVVAVEHNN